MIGPRDLTLNQKAVLLSLAGLPSRYRHDRVYFEKVLFLLAKSDPKDLPDIDATFESWKFGPYNEYVDEVLTGLQEFGAIRGDQMELTPEGRTLASSLSSDAESARLRANLANILSAVDSLSVDDLLYVVYRLYPEFTKNSEIKDAVRSKTLEHFTIKPDRVIAGETLSVESDKGGKLKVRREGDRLQILPST